MSAAPYRLNTDIVAIPDGQFLLPVCTTRERLVMILDCLYFGGLLYEVGERRHLVDVLDAMGRIQPDCELAPRECTTWISANERVDFYPNVDNSDLPHEYLTDAWQTLTGTIPETLLGYVSGDILAIGFPTFLTPPADLPDYIDGIRSSGFPSIGISGLMGRGKVRVYLLSSINGGVSVVIPDDEITKVSVLETNLDLVQFPPENYIEQIYEIEFEGDGEHHIDIVFSPTLDDSLIPIRFGGGFRKVEICGFEENPMTDPCCDDELEKLDKNNLLLEQIISLIGGGFKIVPIDGFTTPPDEAADSCAPDFFDHDTDETDSEVLLQRQKALCITVERYVKALMLAALADMSAPQVLIDWIDSLFPQTVPLALTKVTVVYPSILEGLSVFFNALTGSADATLIACLMITGLSGEKNNTFMNFKSSVDVDTLDTLLVPLGGLVQSSNGLKINFQAFNAALESAYSEDLSEYECPCGLTVPEGCEDFEVVDNLRPETVITPMGGGIYRVQNSTPQVDSLYYADIDSAIAGQAMDIEIPEDTITYPVQTVSSHQIYEVDDTTLRSATTGGFAPVLAVGRVTFSSGVPIDTYYKVTCVSGT